MSTILELAREAAATAQPGLPHTGDVRSVTMSEASLKRFAALLQQRQEPVAWYRAAYPDQPTTNRATMEAWRDCGWEIVPLYAAPVANQPDQWNAAIEAAAEICRKKQCRPEFEPELHDKLLKHAEDEIRALAHAPVRIGDTK